MINTPLQISVSYDYKTDTIYNKSHPINILTLEILKTVL